MIFDIVGLGCPLWRRRQRTTVNVNDFSPFVIPKKTIDSSALSYFPAHTVDHEDSSSNSSDDGCIICLDSFAIGDQIRTLPCDHQYHLECIGKQTTL